MDLFNLMAKLGLNSSEYEQGLDKAGKTASSFSSKAGVAFKAVGKTILAVVGAVTGVATAIAGLLIKSEQYGDEIDKQSQKMGLSAEAYQKWSIAAEMAGSDASTLQTGIRNLTKFMQDLSDGTGESLLALQDLGIGYDDFMNMSFDDQLKTVVEAMQGLEDSTKKTELAQQIFGQRAYQELMPLLNQEKGSIDELFASYEDLGLIMSDEMVKWSAELNDKITLLTKTFQMLGTQIGVELYPQLELFIDGMQEILSGKYDEGIDKISEAIDGLLQKAVDALPQVLDTVADILLKVVESIVNVIAKPEFVSALLKAVSSILKKVIEILPQLVGDLFTLAVNLIDGIFKFIIQELPTLIKQLLLSLIQILTKQLPKLIMDIFDMVINLLKNPKALADAIYELVTGLLQGILELVKSLPQMIFELLPKMFELQFSQNNLGFNVGIQLTKNIINGLGNIAQEIGNKLFAVADMLSTAEGREKLKNIGIGMAQNIVNGLIEMVEKGVNAMIDGISSIWTWLHIPGLDHVHIPRVKWLEEGGLMDALGTIYVAGENGAEIVATGSHGTGVANVEQIEEAVYKANERSNRQLVSAIVNGIVQGVGRSGGAVNMPDKIVVQIGERDFKSAVVSATNEKQFQRGRKTLNRVTGY